MNSGRLRLFESTVKIALVKLLFPDRGLIGPPFLFIHFDTPVIQLRLPAYRSCKWEIFPPNITGLYFNEPQNSGLARGAWMAALSLIDTGRNNAANMYLSSLSYRDTSLSASPPLVVSVSVWPWFPVSSCCSEKSCFGFFFLADRDVTTLVLWAGERGCGAGAAAGGFWECGCIVVLWPGLAEVLILLSPASKQQQNEKAVSKLISSPTHYQTHA